MKMASASPPSSTTLSPLSAQFGLGPPVAAVSWHVRALRLHEGLGLPYELQLDLRTPDAEILAHDMIGVSATLTMFRDLPSRVVHGVVERVQDHGVDIEGRRRFRATVVPALAMLRHRVNTRIFTHASIPEILEQVFSPLTELGRPRPDVFSNLRRQHEPRDLCVQYAETDLDFAHRLMQEAGIVYRFEEDEQGEAEHLVLCDALSTYAVEHSSLPLVRAFGHGHEEEVLCDLVHDFGHRAQVYEVGAYNWRIPDARDVGRSVEKRPMEVYEHDVHRQVTDTSDNAPFSSDPSQSDRRAALLAERSRLRGTTWRARGNAATLFPGANLEIEAEEESRDGLRLIVTELTHEASFPQQDLGDSAPESEYENFVEATTVAFHRDYGIERPTISGPQTARVVGPPDEEIWVDPDGRIQVRFHWERLPPPEETDGWWVRVSSAWAGAGFGMITVPRVGMEVVVEFLNGNPDCPLVTGCVFNAKNRPPYPLPDEKTKSTLRSQSSKDADGFNELRFEDAAGSEELFLHAQKTMTEVVKGSRSSSVGGGRTATVGGDDSTTVSKAQTLTVEGDRTKTISGTETRSVTGARTTDLGADDTCTTAGKTTHILNAGLDVTVLGNAKHVISDKHEVLVTGEHVVTVQGTSAHTVTDTHDANAVNRYAVAQGDVAKVVLESAAVAVWGKSTATLAAGEGAAPPAAVSCTSDGKVMIAAASEISLKCGETLLTLSADGSLTLKGPSKVEIVGGGVSSVALGPNGAETSAPEIKANANGTHEIVGALVKIN